MTDEFRRWDLQLFAEMDGERTEEPTYKRRADARKKGHVNRSMEINNAASILGIMFLLFLLGGMIYDGFRVMFSMFFETLLLQPVSEMDIFFVSREVATHYFRLTGPVLLVAVVVGFAASVLQTGFLFTSEPLQPKLENINPIEGAKKIFSRRALFDLLKTILKIAIIGGVTYVFLKGRLRQLLVLINQDINVSSSILWKTMTMLGLTVGLVYIALAVIDFIYQRYEYEKKLKMTRREVKDERKQLEGDPLVRSRIRRQQMAIARQRMMQDVPTADVVITNPTRIAVALKYDQEENDAPVLVAKGVEIVAKKIREIAEENDVPVVENPPVAQIIWRQTEIGQEIPVELYQAVAEILAAVYRLKEKQVV
ncbi:MAG: flagellar biosynthesis protein FlhB [Dethiobacteria bacterium]